MSNSAALESVIFGELPAQTNEQTDVLLASFGLLGTTVDYRFAFQSLQDTDELQTSDTWWGGLLEELHERAERPMLFRAHQRRLSLEEMGVYESHVAAAEETGEDFFGNFS